MTYSVVVRHRDIESLSMTTAGHLHFRLEEAKKFALIVSTTMS